jgi:hypothetical protein
MLGRSAKNMTHSILYPNPDYTENTSQTNEYSRKSFRAGKTTAKYFKLSAVIFWLPWILSFTGLVNELPKYTLFFTSGSAFTIAILAILLPGRKIREELVACNQCKCKLERETYESCEFYSCKQCKAYIRGGDFS